MIGVERTPASARCSCQRGCSATVVPQATWWTVPALWRPGSARRRVVGDRPAAALAAQLPRPVAGARRAQHALEQRRGCARAGRCRRARRRSPAARARPGSRGARRVSGSSPRRVDRRARGRVPRDRRTAGARRRARLDALAAEPLAPRSRAPPARRRARRCGAPSPRRRGPGAAPGYSKKVMSEPGVALLVGVEQVVDARVVLVDGLRRPSAARARACRSRRCAARRR